MTRSDFGISSPRGSTEERLPGSRLRAAVVGGGAGGRLSLKALSLSGRFDLVAVTDLRSSVCAELSEAYPGIATHTDYRRMFSEHAIDVACVSTWPATHEEIACAAMEFPLRGILVEKPLGDTAAAGRRILNAIKAAALPVAVPHGLLANDCGLEVLRRVHAGEIGVLKLVEVQCHGWDLMNAGIHWTDFFVSLTRGAPMDFVMAQCESSALSRRDGLQVETTGVTYAQTTDGIRLVMQTGDDVQVNRTGKGTLIRVVGSEGVIEFWPWERPFEILNAAHPQPTVIQPEPMAVKGHRFHLERLADQIDAGSQDYSVAEHSLLALEICEGAYLSSRHRCKVRFPVDEFKPPAPVDWDPGRPLAGSLPAPGPIADAR